MLESALNVASKATAALSGTAAERKEEGEAPERKRCMGVQRQHFPTQGDGLAVPSLEIDRVGEQPGRRYRQWVALARSLKDDQRPIDIADLREPAAVGPQQVGVRRIERQCFFERLEPVTEVHVAPEDERLRRCRPRRRSNRVPARGRRSPVRPGARNRVSRRQAPGPWTSVIARYARARANRGSRPTASRKRDDRRRKIERVERVSPLEEEIVRLGVGGPARALGPERRATPRRCSAPPTAFAIVSCVPAIALGSASNVWLQRTLSSDVRTSSVVTCSRALERLNGSLKDGVDAQLCPRLSRSATFELLRRAARFHG